MVTEQTTVTRFQSIRRVLFHFLTGVLLGALAFSFAWTAGLAANALSFMLVILCAMFILRYMTPPTKVNAVLVVGVIIGVLLVVVKPNYSLASLGTEQLVLVLIMLLLMR